MERERQTISNLLPSPLQPPEAVAVTAATSPPRRSHKRKVERLDELSRKSSFPLPPEELASPQCSNQSRVKKKLKKKKRVSSRERLTRHGFEVADELVRIPDQWGQESLLEDWIDCSVFDDSLVPGQIFSARAALIEEKRRVDNHHHSHSHSHSGGVEENSTTR